MKRAPIRPFHWLLCLLALFASITAGSCSSDSSSPTAPVPSSSGTLVLRMTDQPVDDVAELWVYVSGLTLKPAGGPVVRLRAPEFVPGLYDLLNLQNGISVILADAMIEATTYQFIEIELDQSQSYLVELADPAVQVPMQIASGKAKLNGGPFDVLPDGTTTVLFDFDAAKSLKRKGNGDYLLKPFLQILEVVEEPGAHS